MRAEFFKYVLQNAAGMIGVSLYILADTYFISASAGADGITVLNLALPRERSRFSAAVLDRETGKVFGRFSYGELV